MEESGEVITISLHPKRKVCRWVRQSGVQVVNKCPNKHLNGSSFIIETLISGQLPKNCHMFSVFPSCMALLEGQRHIYEIVCYLLLPTNCCILLRE